MKSLPEQHLTVFFDGHCHLCNGTVKFLIDRDGLDRLRFAPMQHPEIQPILEEHGFEIGKSIIVHADGEWWTEASAALRIAGELPGIWQYFTALRHLPKKWQNGLYRWIARNRYRWFGHRESCRMPSPEETRKFIV